MTRDEVHATVVAWLESERVRQVGIANAHGLPLSVSASITVASDVTETGASYADEQIEVSPFYSSDLATRFMRIALSEPPEPEPPSVLYDFYGADKCRIWCPFAKIKLPNRPEYPSAEAANAAFVLRMTRSDYLRGLRSLDHGDEAYARVLTDKLLSLIEGAHVHFVERVPLGGLRVTGALEYDGVTLRSLSGEELGSLESDFSFPKAGFRERPITGSAFTFRSERHLLEVNTAFDKAAANPSSFRAQQVVLAMQLLGFEPRGEGRGVNYVDPLTSPSFLTPLVSLPTNGTTFHDFGPDDLKAAVELADKIPAEVFDGPKTRKGIALHRFRSAAAADGAADAIIDYVTALEVVFLSNDAELAFRLAVFGAHYLGANGTERASLFEDFKVAYKLRSRLVHGSLSPDSTAELLPGRGTVRRLTGRVLINVLLHGMPTQEDLIALCLV